MEKLDLDTSCINWDKTQAIEFSNGLLKKVFQGEELTREECRKFLMLALENRLGEANSSTFGALFAAIMARGGPSVDEVLGFIDVVLWHDREDYMKINDPEAVGVVGSGKDDYKTFNISTGAALAAAAAGGKVVKNGSRSESSVSGTTDMMEMFGVNISPSEEEARRSFSKSNIAFVSAEGSFPRMSKEYVGKFLFVNPLSYILSIASGIEFNRIVFGLSSPDVRFTAEILNEIGFDKSLVVNGMGPEGEEFIDEVSAIGATKVAETFPPGEVEVDEVTPEELGLEQHDASAISQGRNMKENAHILLSSIHPDYAERGYGPSDIVAMNAASTLYAGEETDSLQEGLEMSYNAIESGDVIEKLHQLVEYSGGTPRKLENTLNRFKTNFKR